MDKKEVAQPDIKSVHSLLFGDNNEHITKAVKEEAREIVSDVISEAMFDRQKRDSKSIENNCPHDGRIDCAQY